MYRPLILFATICLGAASSASPVSANAAMCSREVLQALGSCAALSGDGTALNVAIEKSLDRQRPSITSTPPFPPNPANPAKKPFDFASCLAGRDDARACYRATTTPDPASPSAPPSTGAPAITLADLARFAPAHTAIATEPDGAGVARLPVNFTTSATVHSQTAALLGTPLTVRFTPADYDYDFGDGTTAVLATPGRTWEQLDQDPLTPTPSSHTYTASGTYTARLVIRYTAEIDLGAGWTAVPGLLTVESPPRDITVYDAHTALVGHTCVEQPTAPGC